MRMITGFYPPTSGRVTVGGFDIVENPLPAKRLIGYLPENAPGYADMTVHGFLGFAAELRGLAGDAKKKAIHRAVETCLLDGVLYQTIDTLSKGYKHRTCLAQSIIHDPDILILDEPTDGLDPNQKHEVRGLIKRMGENKAIMFSTHILEEVEAACTRVIIIDRGRIVANGTPQELKARAENAGAVRLSVRGTRRCGHRGEAGARCAGGASRNCSRSAAGCRRRARLPDRSAAQSRLRGSVAELAQREQWKARRDPHRGGPHGRCVPQHTAADTVRRRRA